MADITVRRLSADEWATYKDVRLRALQESPDAFVADYDSEAAEPDTFWQDRMERSTRYLAEIDRDTVGVVSVRPSDDIIEHSAELFGLWVTPKMRGEGVAARLVITASDDVSAEGLRQLVYWVSTDNGRAVAFASSFGFRPTEYRRPVRVKGEVEDEEEIAMTLPLNTHS